MTMCRAGSIMMRFLLVVAASVHGLSVSSSKKMDRRVFLGGALMIAGSPSKAQAAEDPVDKSALKQYDDKLFELRYPSDFFAIRRTIEGDISRRGNVLFTAGRLGSAEIVTVERFNIGELLVQADATSFFPDGVLGAWSDLGTPEALGTYICERRDNEAKMAAKGQNIPRASRVIPGTLKVSKDIIQADVETQIGSTDMRVGEGGNIAQSFGVSRIQSTKYVLLPDGKTVMACWGGALNDLWNAGENDVLHNVVASFQAKL